MIADPDDIREQLSDQNPDKRLVALLFLILLVFVGAGIGTIAFDDGGEPGEPTETPAPIELTPESPTPTTTPGEGTPATNESTPAETATPTETATATPSDVTPTDETPPAETATPAPATATPQSGGSGGTGGGGSPSIALQAQGSMVFLQLSNVVPGETGQGSVVVENTGDDPGQLIVNDTAVRDHIGAPYDGSSTVLSSELQVRLSVSYSDGTTEYLFGSASGYVTMADIEGVTETSDEVLAGGEQAEITLEVSLPETTGNEVQGNSVEFDLDFVLQATST